MKKSARVVLFQLPPLFLWTEHSALHALTGLRFFLCCLLAWASAQVLPTFQFGPKNAFPRTVIGSIRLSIVALGCANCFNHFGIFFSQVSNCPLRWFFSPCSAESWSPFSSPPSKFSPKTPQQRSFTQLRRHTLFQLRLDFRSSPLLPFPPLYFLGQLRRGSNLNVVPPKMSIQYSASRFPPMRPIPLRFPSLGIGTQFFSKSLFSTPYIVAKGGPLFSTHTPSFFPFGSPVYLPHRLVFTKDLTL